MTEIQQPELCLTIRDTGAVDFPARCMRVRGHEGPHETSRGSGSVVIGLGQIDIWDDEGTAA